MNGHRIVDQFCNIDGFGQTTATGVGLLCGNDAANVVDVRADGLRCESQSKRLFFGTKCRFSSGLWGKKWPPSGRILELDAPCSPGSPTGC
jgi:hypothetical protein